LTYHTAARVFWKTRRPIIKLERTLRLLPLHTPSPRTHPIHWESDESTRKSGTIFWIIGMHN